MEVFMRNIPEHLTGQNVKGQLRPLMKELDVRDWDCRKSGRNKFGSITFLHQADGQRFLDRYGQKSVPESNLIGKTRSRANLSMFGQPVYCESSFKAPHPLLLRSLSKSMTDRFEARNHERAPDKVVFGTSSLSCGSYRYIDQTLSYQPEITWQTVNGAAKFLKNALVVSLGSDLMTTKVEITYRTIEAVFVSRNPPALTITLWEAPKFFGPSSDLSIAFAALGLNQPGIPAKVRLTELPHAAAKHRDILGQALVYRIVALQPRFEQAVEAITRRQIFTIIPYDLPEAPSTRSKSLTAQLRLYNDAVNETAKKHLIPFEVLYQLECLVRNGFLLPSTVQTLLQRAHDCFRKAGSNIRRAQDGLAEDLLTVQRISGPAVRKLHSQIPFPGLDADASVFDPGEIWRYIETNEQDARSGRANPLVAVQKKPNVAMVYKANVTPTGITLHGPEPEVKNRILRRYPGHEDCFLRVQFCDEDGTDLQFNSSVSNEHVYERFRKIFRTGINICGRVFGFLGFSSSSLHSHSAWFMASFVYKGELQTYDKVISSIGQFEQMRCPARCAARIGQAFSETPLAIPLEAHGIVPHQIPDVKSDDGCRVFSDGVGLLSQPAFDEICRSLPQHQQHPTCFQIRWGGAKGMLTLHTPLPGKAMALRPSMTKFDSQDTANLEICDMGRKPIPMVLNRQMIRILEDMGVSRDWFLDLQQDAIQHLRSVITDNASTVEFLRKRNVVDGIGFPALIRRLDLIGTSYKNDRFLRSVIEILVLRELRLLRYKARIPVADGVTLFGIMDETGYLNEGEIFITFDRSASVSARFLDLDRQVMIVTRSPALHPGDIQLATNIIPSAPHPLRSLRNCIIFSQKGKRDLPSCLSGGDLDGDLYQIIWDQVAVEQCHQTHEPADYPRVEVKELDRPVNRDDMADFFVHFMATDQLGLLAVKHMILADQRADGTADEDCIKLAEMHSTAVDYPKTGVATDMGQLRGLRIDRFRPDFLSPAPLADLQSHAILSLEASTALADTTDDEDDDDSSAPMHQYYGSKKILGELYRNIDERQVWREDIKIPNQQDRDMWKTFHAHVQAELKGFAETLNKSTHLTNDAKHIRRAYEGAMENARYDFSEHASKSITELEVFTGDIFNRTGAQTRRQRDRSIKLKDEFDRIARWTAGMIRARGVKAAEDDDEQGSIKPRHVGSEMGLALSWACFNVDCQQDETRSSEGRLGGTFDSFKVIAACCLMKEMDAAAWRRDELSDTLSF